MEKMTRMMTHSQRTGGDGEVGMTVGVTTEEVVEMIEIEKTMVVMIGMIDMIEEMTGEMREGTEMDTATEATEIGTEIVTAIGEEEAEVEKENMIGTDTEIRIDIGGTDHHETVIDPGTEGIETAIGSMIEAESTKGLTDTAMKEAMTTQETDTDRTNIAQNQALALSARKTILRILV